MTNRFPTTVVLVAANVATVTMGEGPAAMATMAAAGEEVPQFNCLLSHDTG